jgi:hypothetical protein
MAVVDGVEEEKCELLCSVCIEERQSNRLECDTTKFQMPTPDRAGVFSHSLTCFSRFVGDCSRDVMSLADLTQHAKYGASDFLYMDCWAEAKDQSLTMSHKY